MPVTAFARGGLVFKAHRLSHHSILGSKVVKKKKKKTALVPAYPQLLWGCTHGHRVVFNNSFKTVSMIGGGCGVRVRGV